MKSILFICENYIPFLSGVPVVVKYLAEGLQAKGHDVAIATQAFQDEPMKDTINGVKVYRFNIWKDWKHCYKGDLRGFLRFVVEYNADVNILECTQCITTDTLLPHLNKIKGRKYFHIHGISGLSPQNKLFMLKSDVKHTIGNIFNWFSSRVYFGYTLKNAMPYFNATMCLSKMDDGIDYIKKYSRQNYILDNAADNMFFDEAFCSQEKLSKYAKLENQHYLVSCANYTYIKNQLGIITEYYASKSSSKYSLICIGSMKNDYYDECQQLIQKLELKYGHRDVRLLYGVNRTDIPAIINKASIYLVGSFLEQYSISIIEAMSQGVPFISTNVGNASILPGGVTVDNAGDMHTVIDYLLNNPAVYKDYSCKGRDYAYNNCRISVAVDKLEQIISK